ncbi:cupin domain-containing protein [Sphingobium scionense]
MSEPKRPEDLHPDNWEMHPDGDEILHLVEGDIDLVVEDESGEILLPLARGQSCVVERGTWHRLLLRAPSRLMFLTPVAARACVRMKYENAHPALEAAPMDRARLRHAVCAPGRHGTWPAHLSCDRNGAGPRLDRPVTTLAGVDVAISALRARYGDTSLGLILPAPDPRHAWQASVHAADGEPSPSPSIRNRDRYFRRCLPDRRRGTSCSPFITACCSDWAGRPSRF